MSKAVYATVDGTTRRCKKLYACIKEKYQLANLAPAIYGANGWNAGAASAEHAKYAAYALLLTGDVGSSESFAQSNTNFPLDSTHIYYARVEVYQENAVGGAGMYWPIAEPSLFSASPAKANEWTICSVVVGRSEFSGGSYPIRLDFDNAGVAGQMWFDGLMLIDLTAAFGAGNEPDAEWCDSMIPYFAGTYELDYDAAPILTHIVKKAYAVVNGVTRLFYSEDPVVYTGEYTSSTVTYNGKTCELYILTGSGKLTLKEDALVWMCGGGASGTGGYTDDADSHNGGRGGGGGYVNDGSLTAGEYTITVGAGADYGGKNGGTTKVTGASTLSASGGKSTGAGGSGGGSGGTSPNATTKPSAGAGKGVSTYPFGLTSLRAHCAGGGGGISYIEYKDGTCYYGPGGDGGSNGSNGGAYKDGIESAPMAVDSGWGGVYGGGRGSYCKYNGSSWTVYGTAGTFYGAGGGGTDYSYEWDESKGAYNAQGYVHSLPGYQGVVYILFP